MSSKIKTPKASPKASKAVKSAPVQRPAAIDDSADSSSLLMAHVLNKHGGSTPVDWEGVDAWKPRKGPLWLHLDRENLYAQRWLLIDSKIDPLIVTELLEEETRPRALRHGNGLLVNLRGINMNAGAEPDDMVSVRVWLEKDRVISTREMPLLAMAEIERELQAGTGAVAPDDFLVRLASGLLTGIELLLDELEASLDLIEDSIFNNVPTYNENAIATVQRQASRLRRYVSPQRAAIAYICTDAPPWFGKGAVERLREVNDRLIHFIEDLDSIRDRALICQQQMSTKLSERMGRATYTLTMIAGVFLPLTFITGLLGINVGGIPGAGSDVGFLIVCGVLIFLLLLELFFVKFHKRL